MSETQTAPVAERSDLLRGAALATAGIAAAGLLSARAAQAQTPTTGTPVTVYFQNSPGTGAIQVPKVSTNFPTASIDVQVVNYALTLETLEAELYRQAVIRLTGSDPSGNNNKKDMFGNTISAASGVNPQSPDVLAAIEFAKVEMQHRDLLTFVMGNNWVVDAKAKFDFGFADTNNFGTPALTYQQTQQLLLDIELTGTTAYTGAIPFFTAFGVKNFLPAAAGIAGTEARHTAYLAAILSTLAGSTTYMAPETTPQYNENNARDTTLKPDEVLNLGGKVIGDTLTLPPGGTISPASGPKGFGGKGFVFV